MSRTRNKLHLFNPENDLALALGCRHYTPPPHAAQLHRAGALLPAWWASDCDSIIAPYSWVDEDVTWIKSHWGLKCDTATLNQGYIPSPWGWSADAIRQFMIAGIDRNMLPSDSEIERLRQLSHRHTSIDILSALGEENLLPEEVTDPQRAVELEHMYPGSYFKSPWSCSGRGVFCARGLTDKVLHDKTSGIIHRQGSVMAEKGYNKVADLGALFECTSERVCFRGLSMFVTEARGVYTGNIVASQQYFHEQADKLGVLDRLNTAVSQLETVLTQLLTPLYRGWAGIDMLIYDLPDNTRHLHPCIELNLRMTMGVAAMKVAERISPTHPHLMGWQKISGISDLPPDHLLLPPREGFALTLTAIH